MDHPARIVALTRSNVLSRKASGESSSPFQLILEEEERKKISFYVSFQKLTPAFSVA
jgi:hypothetical protein